MLHRPERAAGFSLIEAAIVLGIIGLVIGGIWVASAQMVRNAQLNRTLDALLTIAMRGGRMFSAADYPATLNATTDVTPVFVQAGIIPADFISNGAFKSLWGTEMRTGLRNCNVVCPQGIAFQIRLYYNDPAICNRMLSAVAKRFTNNSFLQYIHTTNGSTQYGGAIPLSFSTFSCPTGAGYMEFLFTTNGRP